MLTAKAEKREVAVAAALEMIRHGVCNGVFVAADEGEVAAGNVAQDVNDGDTVATDEVADAFVADAGEDAITLPLAESGRAMDAEGARMEEDRPIVALVNVSRNSREDGPPGGERGFDENGDFAGHWGGIGRRPVFYKIGPNCSLREAVKRAKINS